MKNYVSETFTKELLDGMNKENIYLVGSECGSGKTTAIMTKLIPYAKEQNKKVLFLCNRKTLKKQLDHKYKWTTKYDEMIEKNLNLTLKMYQSINEIMEMNLVDEIIGMDFDYIVIDEAHLIYDASDYDFKAHRFIQFINEWTPKSTIIALSGTPDSFLKLENYFTRSIKQIRYINKENNKIRRVLLTTDKKEFKETILNYLDNQYKTLSLVSYAEMLKIAKLSFANKDMATLLSEAHEEVEKYMDDKDQYVLQKIIEEEEMICDVIVATKFLDVGVNIETHQNFLVAYYCNEMINTIEQFRSRLRFEENSSYHLDLLFKVMTKQSSTNKIKKIKMYLQRYDELYKAYGTFEEILKHNPKQKFKVGFGAEPEDYEQYNQITRQLKLDQLSFYEKLSNSDNLLETYKEVLQEMYPHVEIVTLQDLKVKKYLDNLMYGKEEILFKNDEAKQKFREDMRELNIVTVHKKNLPSLTTICDGIKSLGYVLEDKRVYVGGETKYKRCWKLTKSC
ncbi:DEAD/DEAH box helicase family protein [Kurthia populi]|uniref:DEAD/DEAH box helicase family protein n=1 Tax=Kurthia populi TaxID=1562132 RepID=A0ABW5XZD4_9BACL